jgi:gliding motility-associated-like protein
MEVVSSRLQKIKPVMITDDNGCTFYDSFVVTQPATPLSGSVTIQTNVACYSDSTGTVTVAGQGGTAPYEYCIDGGAYQGSGTFTDLPAGNYTITVRDANLCVYNVPVTITEPASALSGSIQNQTNVLCFGDNTGSVTVAGSDGTSPYEYNLDGGAYQPSGTFSNLTATDYIITIRDANFCVLDLPVTITEPADPLTGSITSQTNVGCFGEATGSVTVLGTGGTAPCQYCLDGGTYQSSGTFSGLTADTYTVTVRDANGCTTDVPVTITEPLALTGSITDKVNVACFGDATGSVTVTGTDGTPPYQYSLDGGSYQSPGTFTDLSADDYTVTIRDANLCTVDIPVTITEPPELTAGIVSQTNVNCYGNATGSVTVSGSGGTTPYAYSLDGGAFQSSGTFNDLVATGYTVTVRDANLCTCDILLAITEPEELSGVIVELFNACYGEASGYVTIQGEKGVEPYEYSLDGGPFQSGGTFNGLAASDYIITIRDANSCTTNIPVTITQAATAVSVTILNHTNVRCYGDATGSVSVAGSGGTPPYEYTIDGGDFQASGTFNNLIASSYVLTIRDANHCTVTIPVTITQPASGLAGSITDKTDVLCPEDETGSLTVTASGGTPPYEYSLNGGPYQINTAFTGLAAAGYTVTIRDANLCTLDLFTTVTGPDPFEISPIITGETCEGEEDGDVILNPTGGTPPYTFLWSNSETTENLNNIGGGIYTIIITDANECTYEYDIEVVITGEDCLLIPNAFIPNNDGMNDTWRIRSIEAYPNATVHVYSRWGQLVFSAENGYADPWDGTYKGKDLPMDSYFYVIDLKNGKEPITGQVTIIR